MKFNRYAFVLACTALVHNSASRCHVNPIESMHKSMKVMEDEMQSMFDTMNKIHQEFFSSWKKESAAQPGQEGINIAINEDDSTAVKVIISGIQAEQFDATFNDKELTIKAPTATIILASHHAILAASINQEIKQETIDKDDKEKTSHQLFSSSSHVRQMISKPVNMEDAIIDYNKETKTLTVTLPAKESKKRSKIIPVMIK